MSNPLVVIRGTPTYAGSPPAVAGATLGPTRSYGLGAAYTIEGFAKIAVNGPAFLVGSTSGSAWIGAIQGQATIAGFAHAINCSDGAEHHWSYNRDSNGGETLYLDGVLSSTSNGNSFPANPSLAFGGQVGDSSFPWSGSFREVAIFGTCLRTGAFTPPSGYTGSEADLVALYHLGSSLADSATGSGGSFGLAATDQAITLTVTGISYSSYQFYRSTVANFTPSPSTLLASQAGTSYVDSAAAPGTVYFYAVTAKDSANTVYNLAPVGLDGASSATSYSLSARRLDPPVIALFCGDSNTAGYIDPGVGPCGPACDYLRTAGGGLRAVTYVNAGIGGTSTQQWLPNSGALEPAFTAFDPVVAANPTALQVVSICLGTNDSPGPLDTPTYQSRMAAIIAAIHAKYPSAKIVLHGSSWFSPNAHSGLLYNGASLDAIRSYRTALTALAAANPSYVSVGDLDSFDVTAANYLTLQVPQQGDQGAYYLHYSHAGNLVAGQLWGAKIAGALGLLGSGSGSNPVGTDPGYHNVKSGVTYTDPTGTNRVGDYDPITNQYTNPGAANVLSTASYKFAGVTITGTATGGGSYPSAADIATAVGNIPVEGSITLRQALAPILAASAGVVAGAGTGVVVIKGGNSATTRITATTDAAGNRSQVTLNLPS